MGKRILIVEDDSDIASGIEFLLRREGHDVEVVGCAADAVECADDFWPEIAFIETGLPDRSGYDLCRELRSIPTEAPPYILLLSPNTGEDEIAEGRAAGANDFVQIPFVTLDLLARLRPQLGELAA